MRFCPHNDRRCFQRSTRLRLWTIAWRYALAALLLACFIACSGERQRQETTGLRVGIEAEVQDLDPHLVTGVPEHRVLSALFEGLVSLDPASGQPIPGVAASWEVSDDERVYRFYIRPDAEWSDGTPLTAQDFVLSWRRVLSPTLAAEYAYLLYCLKQGAAFHRKEMTDPGQVGAVALDDHTLEVHLERPTPYFLAMQIHMAWYPVPKHVVEKYGPWEERGTPWTLPGRLVSNGPYHLVEWRPNEYIRVKKNPHYWNAGGVPIPEIVFYPIENLQTEERMFRNGALDMTANLAFHLVSKYQRDNPQVLRLDPYLGTYFYRLNVTRGPLQDKRVRQALSLALDRDDLCRNVLRSGERPAFTFVPPELALHSDSYRLSYDPARAKTLLAEAGYPEGKNFPPLEILYNTSEAHKTIAEAIQRQWAQTLGIEVRLTNQEWKVYLSSLDTLDYSVARSGWIADVPDAINFLECFLKESGNNRTGFASAEYDQIIHRIYDTLDPEARRTLMEQAEAILLDEAPVIPIYFYIRRFLISPRVSGYTPNPLGFIRWQMLQCTP